jgi:glycosyltransferase involved in cell wall biosynthesis
MVAASRAGPDAPRVSVGLPVFNGERFIADAVGSVLAQSFPDFELIVQDNASTDGTEELVRTFAARDARVRYFRNSSNLGAAPNYNLAFHTARGEYFKWLAHDDRLMPDYLAETVSTLDERPDAVLCNTVVRYIDAQGSIIGTYDSGLRYADVASAAERFARMVLSSHSCVDFFGLIRRSAMQGSLLHGSFHGADRAFLAQMALRGRFVQLAEPLVEMREHSGRYTRRHARASERLAWHDASLRGRINFPTWRVYAEYLKSVHGEPLSARERVKCYAVLARWWATNWNAARAAVDILALIAPGAPGAAERLKARLFGAAPGHLVREPRQ